MIKRVNLDFDKEIRYKLYRRVKDIITPSISKRNISLYKIVFDDNLLPVRVFYPKKVSNIENIVIYVPGDVSISKCKSKYAEIMEDLALDLDKLVIAIDYYDIKNKPKTLIRKIEELVNYLYKELEKAGINSDNITLMGDSTGSNIITEVTNRLISKKLSHITKEVLLYPIKNKEENMINYPKTLIITGDLDPEKESGLELFKKLNEDSKYLNIEYAQHGFISTNDIDIKHKYLEGIKNFI